MNKGIWAVIGLIIIILLIILLTGRDANAPTGDLATSTPEGVEELSGSGTYGVDTNTSVLEWTAKKTLIADYTDRGTVDIEGGTIQVVNGVITAGMFSIDMNTINANTTSNLNGAVGNLTNHLKSPDFFDTEAYATSTFVVRSVTQTEDEMRYEVTGDLTIKGTTNSITFPALIYMLDGNLFVEAVATVDRTDFGVRYGSSNFFDDLGDNVIDDNFILNIKLVAVPEANQNSGTSTSTIAQ